MVSPKEPTVRSLISKWSAYRSGDVCQIKDYLYRVRNPGFNGNPPISAWPTGLVDPDDEIMASVEHYYLARCWVGSGQYPAWEVRLLKSVYDLGKSIGVTPRHNPSKPVTPPSDMQKKFQDEGILDGETDLKKSGISAPLIEMPPTY